MRRFYPTAVNPTDADLRELERKAQEGDGEAALDLLNARARSGQLPTNDPLDLLIAFHNDGARDVFYEGYGTVTNEAEFVERVLVEVAKAREGGVAPHLISTAHGDEETPPMFGRNLAADVDWLGRTYRDFVANAYYDEVRTTVAPLAAPAFHLAARCGTGLSEEVLNEAIRYMFRNPDELVAQPDLLVTIMDTSSPHQDRLKALVIAALRWHLAITEGAITDVEDC